MSVPAAGILDIVILVYYTPALLLALYAALKHGFDRQAGWLNLILLGLFRLVGSSLGLAGIYSPSSGVIAASLILSSMGTVSLIGALLGLVGRVNQHMEKQTIPPRTTRFMQLAIIAAIVLAIIGGTKTTSSDPSTQNSGHDLTKAAVVILLIVFIIAASLSLYTFAMKQFVLSSEMRLLYAAVLSLPFIMVRVIYANIAAFDYTSSHFSMLSNTDSAVAIRAIMGALMEFIAVALFLWAGLTVERSVERDAERAKRHQAGATYQTVNGHEMPMYVERQKPYQPGTY